MELTDPEEWFRECTGPLSHSGCGCIQLGVPVTFKKIYDKSYDKGNNRLLLLPVLRLNGNATKACYIIYVSNSISLNYVHATKTAIIFLKVHVH